MHIFRHINVDTNNDGVVIDMIYDMVDGYEKIRELYTYFVIDGVVSQKVDCDPAFKIGFAVNILKILEQERMNNTQTDNKQDNN